MGKQVKRIVLEPSEDGSPLFKAHVETPGDTVGHSTSAGRLEIEPLDEETGEPTYRVTIDGEDVEGHGMRWSDRRLKIAMLPVEW